MPSQPPTWPGLDTHDELQASLKRSKQCHQRMRTRNFLGNCPKCGFPTVVETRWDSGGPKLVSVCVNSFCDVHELSSQSDV